MRYPRLDVIDPAGGTHQLEVVLSRKSRAGALALAARPDMVARVTTTDGALLCAVLPGPAYGSLAGTGHLPRLGGPGGASGEQSARRHAEGAESVGESLPASTPFVIALPLFNDWTALAHLLPVSTRCCTRMGCAQRSW